MKKSPYVQSNLIEMNDQFKHALVFGQPLDEMAKEMNCTKENVSYHKLKFEKLNMI